MTIKPKPIEVQVGTALTGGIHFISQHQIKNPDAAFSIDLPGTVYCCGDAVVQKIVPRARIVAPGKKPVQAARIVATVTDNLTRNRARDALLAQIDSTAPLSFALRFSLKHSFAQVLEAASDESCGCGCSCGAGAALRGSISIGLAPGAGGNLKWSDPIRARIYARADGALDFGGQEKAECIAVRDNCSEDWFLFDGTICTGFQCTAPEVCKLGDNAQGVPQISSDEWVFCNCNV